MEPIDLTKVLTEEFDGKWVVLSKDYKKVIASGDSIAEIEKYIGMGIVMKVILGCLTL